MLRFQDGEFGSRYEREVCPSEEKIEITSSYLVLFAKKSL